MSQFYALNAGTADCLVVFLTCKDTRKTIVIDGGSLKDPYRPLPDFLTSFHVTQIDLMVLTHLHQDHLGSLCEISETFPILEAVVPYPPIPLSDHLLNALYSQNQQTTTRAYNQLYHSLKRRCRLHTTYPFTGPQVYPFGDYSFTCLYPKPGTVSPVWSAFERLLCTPTQQAQLIADEGRGNINGDSSVWLLEQGSKPLLLLCGDCLDSHIAQGCRNHGVNQVEIIKLSHHGRNDKGRVYYTPNTIQGLSPSTVVVCANESIARQYDSQLKDAAGSARLCFTWETQSHICLEL